MTDETLIKTRLPQVYQELRPIKAWPERYAELVAGIAAYLKTSKKRTLPKAYQARIGQSLTVVRRMAELDSRMR